MKRLAIVALVALGLVLAGCSSEDEEAAPETAAALEVQTEEGQIDGFFNFDNGPDKSFGLFTCSNVDAVTLEKVEAIDTEGEIEFLGARVFQASEGFIGAVDGFPPTGLVDDATGDLEDFVVDVPCEDADAETKLQIVLGASRTGDGGGQIKGIKLTHSEGELVIDDYRIVLCGDDYEYCEALRPNT